ncbi:ABC transporter permease [Thermodesulfobacteriota bacterium]
MMKTLLSNWHRKGFHYLIFGCLVLLGAYFIDPETISSLRFSPLGTLKLNSRYMFFILGCFVTVAGFWGTVTKERNQRLHKLLTLLNVMGIIFLVLIWAGMGRRIDVVGLAAQSLRLATPISLGALAGILCERSGVVNIGIEGMMLAAACVGFTIALYAQSIWVGFLAAVAGGALMATLHAVLCIRMMADQIVSGTVINILAVGVTGFMRRAFLLNNPLEPPGILPTWRIPGLSEFPVLGKILFAHQPMVYCMLILVGLVHIVIFHTRWGLRTRTVGEHPKAADTLGISVYKIRYINVILGGMIAGLGGAWFSLEMVGSFEEIMTGGKGFIALAAMIFGKWNPFGALCGAMLFGFADALQIKLQIMGVHLPYQILGMLPYVLTLVVLAGFVGRTVAPAADGVPYERDSTN